MQKLVNAGGTDVLGVYFGATAKPTSFLLRLITDATALADSDVGGTSHTTAAGGGYADITLYPEGGSAPAGTRSVVSQVPQIAWPKQTWNFTGALTGSATITGYQILKSDGTLIIEEASANMTPAAGYSYSITPVIQLGNGAGGTAPAA